MSTQSTEEINATLARIIKCRTKITVVFHHTKTRRALLNKCILRDCGDGFIVATSGDNEIRFWESDIEQISGGQINLSFVS